MKVKGSVLVFLREYSVDLILTTTFRNLSFISNVIVAYISIFSAYISFQMLLQIISQPYVVVEFEGNKWGWVKLLGRVLKKIGESFLSGF